MTEIECTYKASLLKKKADSHNNPEILKELHEQASNTLEVLTMNMIATDVSLEHIFEYYKKITRENVIKLLLRCKKMYEARVEVKKILTLIIKKDGVYKWIMGMIGADNLNLSEPECQRIYDCKRLLHRVISSVHQFRHEHKIFKGTFVFKGQDYQETCNQQFEEL